MMLSGSPIIIETDTNLTSYYNNEPTGPSSYTTLSHSPSYKQAMTALASTQRDAECSVIDLEAENEHFEICDSLISCIELIKSGSNCSPVSSPMAQSPESCSSASNDSHESKLSYHDNGGDENPIDGREASELTTSTSKSHQRSQSELPEQLMWDITRSRSRSAHNNDLNHQDDDENDLPSRQNNSLSNPTASAIAWSLIKKFSDRQQQTVDLKWLVDKLPSNIEYSTPKSMGRLNAQLSCDREEANNVRIRGNFEWAPPRAQIIFNIHSNPKLKKLLVKQNFRCAGCGIKIDQEMARRLVLYCNYLGKYFCKCCHSHKAIHLPGYILQKWDFHKYPVSHFALQLLDRISNEPLFNINDTNPSLYQKVKKLRRLLDVRMQLYYLQIYLSTCKHTTVLNNEFKTFAHQHLLQDEVHLYSLNNLIEIQHGKLFEYLNDLVSRSIAHVAQCDICRAKGHYCQLCGPRSLISSSRTQNDCQINSESSLHSGHQSKTPNHTRTASGNFSQLASGNIVQGVSPISNGINSINIDDPELIFPFEIGRVAQCRLCGCCFHLQCFLDAGQNCPKCERIQRRKVEKSQDS